ncbi:uncharacterized protein LOC112341367 isoform X3 [Selaginella moellendorffii]|uniref:uncharacterized protein LOC112341367 isoform X3 n=1 Tax=Selaginella moellendorffii TaxID=88036 RepID=UPI000D1C2F5D|nr:uncharacterized protein LOC112341367 isoform X3 [Selaginella moellendorffii]|eukprot:XP_024517085.1 uncharacterized protein LOC112341367 isoform X3 [Selaginella moellendorffii]
MADERSRRDARIIRESRYTAVLLETSPSVHDIPGLTTASGRALSQPSVENLERALELMDARVQLHDNELEDYLLLRSPARIVVSEQPEQPIDVDNPEDFQLEE